MNDFIQKKIASVFTGAFVSLLLISASFLSIFYGKEALVNNFYLGAIALGIAPFIVFCTAFLYQGRVVFPMKQIFVFSSKELTGFQKHFVNSIKEGYTLARLVPIAVTIIGALASVTIIPGAIGPHVFGNDVGFYHKAFASLVLSANFLLFLKMSDQIVLAKNSLKES